MDDQVTLDRSIIDMLCGECGWSLSGFVEFYRPGALKELAELEAAHAAGDVETVAILAHGAAGSSATLGLTSLVGVYRDLNRCARDKGIGPELSKRVRRTVDHVAAALRALEQLAQEA